MMGVGPLKKGAPTTVSLHGSIERIAAPSNLDESVEEVFAIMLGTSVRRENQPEFMSKGGSVTAVVGFGGLLSGACILRTSGQTARKFTAMMTGTEFAEVDDTVKDAIGELCNMLAGSWKNKVPELAEHCGLSVPAVISGTNYVLHVQEPEFELMHTYGIDGAGFELRIVCDGVL